MSIALGVGLVLLLLAVLAAQFMIFPALWIGFRDHWRRAHQKKRRRGIVAGTVAATLLIVGLVLSVAQPWGPTALST